MKRPTPKEVTDYALSINFKLDGEHFCDFYGAKGWMIGKSHMVNWKLAVNTWKRSHPELVIKSPVDIESEKRRELARYEREKK